MLGNIEIDGEGLGNEPTYHLLRNFHGDHWDAL
jgi:hypothetical protein